MLNNIGLPGLLLLFFVFVVGIAALVKPRSPNTPRGSAVWLLIWAVIFFPFAIVYALMRRWSDPEQINEQPGQDS
jgi:O-antigen ligase